MVSALSFLTAIGPDIRFELEPSTDVWAGSPFAWIRHLAPRTRAVVGRRFVEEWLKHCGVAFAPSHQQGSDLIVGAIRVELRFSTLWKGENVYSFNQIKDDNYDLLFCLGVSPRAVHAWAVPKRDLDTVAPGQHTGARARETQWLHFRPDEAAFLAAYGPTLERATDILVQESER